MLIPLQLNTVFSNLMIETISFLFSSSSLGIKVQETRLVKFFALSTLYIAWIFASFLGFHIFRSHSHTLQIEHNMI